MEGFLIEMRGVSHSDGEAEVFFDSAECVMDGKGKSLSAALYKLADRVDQAERQGWSPDEVNEFRENFRKEVEAAGE